MLKLNMFGQNVKKFLKESLFPENFCCLLCDIEIFEGELCGDCLKALSLNNGTVCPKCGRKTAESEICIECKAKMPTYEFARSPLVYEKGSSDLVNAFKNGRPFIAKYLASLIAQTLKDIPKVDGIVFVPLSDKALRKRGYNQSELLAAEVSKLAGISVLYGAVEKIKETPKQKNLTREKRFKNLQECFKANKEQVRGKTLLVIDDILTTGATVDSMTQALKKAGTCAVFVVTAASVEYKI